MTQNQVPLPNRLKHARQVSGISQKSLGIAIGIDQFVASARMNQYEKGVHFPSYQTVKAIADHLKYPVSYFYEKDEGIASLLEAIKDMGKIQLKNLVKNLSKNR